MSIKPDERPKVIGLVAGTCVMLLIAVTRVLPLINGDKTAAQNGAANPVATPSVASGTLPGAASPFGAAGGNPNVFVNPAQSLGNSTKLNMYNDAAPEQATTRDPFTPAVQTVEMLDAFARPTIPPNNFQPTRGAITRVSSSANRLPPFRPGTIFPGTGGPPAGGITPGADASSPASQMVLAGVIAGPQAVAVIHVGDKAYPLSTGERMPYDMSLTRITEEGVYVKQGKQTWFIPVGKSLSAAMSVKPGMQGFKAPGSMAAPAVPAAPVRRLATAEDGQAVNTVDLVSPTAKESAPETPARPQP